MPGSFVRPQAFVHLKGACEKLMTREPSQDQLSPSVATKRPETSGHTPGPWSIRPMVDCPGFWVFGADLNAVAITGSHPLHDDCADARLIAAAPDMLEALQSVVRDIESMAGVQLGSLHPNDFDIRKLKRVVATALGAIAVDHGDRGDK